MSVVLPSWLMRPQARRGCRRPSPSRSDRRRRRSDGPVVSAATPAAAEEPPPVVRAAGEEHLDRPGHVVGGRGDEAGRREVGAEERRARQRDPEPQAMRIAQTERTGASGSAVVWFMPRGSKTRSCIATGYDWPVTASMTAPEDDVVGVRVGVRRAGRGDRAMPAGRGRPGRRCVGGLGQVDRRPGQAAGVLECLADGDRRRVRRQRSGSPAGRRATGASSSTVRASTSRRSASAVSDFDSEPMTNGVSGVTGRPAASAVPTRGRASTWPSRTTAIEAPG